MSTHDDALIEAIARAIAEARDADWDNLIEFWREAYVAQACAAYAAMVEHLGLTWEPDTDGSRPHRFPRSAIGEEVLGWTCQACGEWIREFGPYEPGECSVDWRSEGKRRLVSEWQEVEP